MDYKKVPAGKKLVWERVSRFPQFSILIALLLLLIVFSFVSNSFLLLIILSMYFGRHQLVLLCLLV